MLELVLKTKWFDMIEEGEKLEEYRELKPYWWSRIFSEPYHKTNEDLINLPLGGYNGKHKAVRFRLGYQPKADEMIFKMGQIRVGLPREEWSEPGTGKCIVIPLLERLSDDSRLLLKRFYDPNKKYNFSPGDIHQLKELERFGIIQTFASDWGVSAKRI